MAPSPPHLGAWLLWNTGGEQDLAENSAGFAVLKQLSVRCENGNLEQKM